MEAPSNHETEEVISDSWADLAFDVQRSVRYHKRRSRFFERFNMLSTTLALIFGSATIIVALKEWGVEWVIGAGVSVTIFSAIDLVIGTARSAWLHNDLAKRFIQLEQRIVRLSDSDRGDKELREMTADRLAIEADEPPVLRALDTLCYNEQARAIGRTEFKPVKWYQRWFAQIADIGWDATTKA